MCQSSQTSFSLSRLHSPFPTKILACLSCRADCVYFFAVFVLIHPPFLRGFDSIPGLTCAIRKRYTRFTSHFGKALTQKLNINQNLSTAFHPQTDGISERNNQWVEQYLRLVTSAQPEDWTNWLSLASAVHNNRKNATTELSPNQVLLGYETTLVPTETPLSNNDLAEDRIKLLMERRAQAIDAINQSAKADQTVPPQYSKGDQVWLEATNLKFMHRKSKLLPKRYGPFKVIKKVSPVAFQLALPPSWNIHDVFHASLLTPYRETITHGPNFS